MKKILIASVAMFALAVFPAFASIQHRDNNCCSDRRGSETCCPSVTIDNDNRSDVDNNVLSVANTGLNGISGSEYSSRDKRGHEENGNSGLINTGAADAYALADTDANNTMIDVTAPAKGAVTVNNDNNGSVDNNVGSFANSGLNRASRGEIRTGAASSDARAMTVVNFTTIKVN